MKKQLLITIIVLLILNTTKAQKIISEKYYNDKFLQKEVLKEKAKYSETILSNPDGSITTERKNIKHNKVVRSETYKGDEPVGIWIYQIEHDSTDKLDYNFSINYADEKCNDSIANLKIDDYFKDNDSIGYKAPKILTGELSINQFLVNRIVYPVVALESGISGKVYTMFTITKEGIIENITVKKSAGIILDKEAVRVIRLLKFANPPMLKGIPQSFCLKLPISFQLR